MSTNRAKSGKNIFGIKLNLHDYNQLKKDKILNGVISDCDRLLGNSEKSSKKDLKKNKPEIEELISEEICNDVVKNVSCLTLDDKIEIRIKFNEHIKLSVETCEVEIFKNELRTLYNNKIVYKRKCLSSVTSNNLSVKMFKNKKELLI